MNTINHIRKNCSEGDFKEIKTHKEKGANSWVLLEALPSQAYALGSGASPSAKQATPTE
jgi:hypothetical protein